MRSSFVFPLLAVAISAVPSMAHGQAGDGSTKPPARENRLALSLSFGGGWTDLGRFNALAADVRAHSVPAGATLSSDLGSHGHIAAELALRYYAPYHLMAQVGYGALYNWNSAELQTGAGVSAGSVENHQIVMEIPILVGGYVPVHSRINVYGAAGPSGFFFAKSYWDASGDGFPDFEADGGVGFHALGGAEFFLASHAALGIELRYRFLRSGDLREQESDVTVTTGNVRGDGSTDTYDLDWSSFSAMLSLRMFFL